MAVPWLGPLQEVAIKRLVLWNIDLTLVDVAIVTRDAYAEAFRAVTGRPMLKLAPARGRPDSEIVFETLAVNGIVTEDDTLPRFLSALAMAFADRRKRLATEGRAMAGAKEALKAVAKLDGVVQSVLTGTIKSNAVHKLRAFGLEKYIDFELGGYGEEVYPKASLLQVAQGRAKTRFGEPFTMANTVVIGDSTRDVQAAKIGGAAMIGVASGRSMAGELREAGADLVLPDLSNASEVVAAVAGLTAPSGRKPVSP
ncbi:HAD family hydrolase [Nonomuraea guangzhouensis]|uniref:HAD family hydrolase n=1 Tax=Nonomuraea guangzhouensis TaxID=1291555 RepID=A0ABW4GIH3_9ACTN|nr:haloacid dehalogenase-like hydrolase [Nonomuraea guangzhouensis]